MCTVTLTLEIWPWVKIMTHPWVMDNYCVKYHPDLTCQWGVIARTRISSMCVLWSWPWRYDLGSRSWHTLGSRTTIVWNYIQIGQGSTKLWPGHDVNRRTDGRTDGQTDRQGDSYIPPNFVCRGGGGGIMTSSDGCCCILVWRRGLSKKTFMAFFGPDSDSPSFDTFRRRCVPPYKMSSTSTRRFSRKMH